MAKDRVQVIIPTAINVLTATNEVLITRAKAGEPTEVELPSLRRRALMMVKEQGVLTVQLDVPVDATDFTR
jgi:hypothetical protein